MANVIKRNRGNHNFYLRDIIDDYTGRLRTKILKYDNRVGGIKNVNK